MNYFHLNIFLLNIFAYSIATEYVPVYFWGSSNSAQLHSALEKINEDLFSDIVTQSVDKNAQIVVFAEETLSPEDLVQKNSKGEISFPNLHKYAALSQATYLPSVQNPFSTLRSLKKDIVEMSIQSILKNVNVPLDSLLIVDLNDAKDGEHRNEMLKRHDSNIHIVYEKLLTQNKNIVAFYTARHSSWVAPEGISRKSRSLLQNKEEGANILIEDKNLLLVTTSVPKYSEDGVTFKDLPLTGDVPKVTAEEVTFNLNGDGKVISFVISFDNGYYTISSVKLGDQALNYQNVPVIDSFSYHCTDFALRADKTVIRLPGMQIQPFVNGTEKPVFGDSFDCVGFTSIPIWSGIFVTLLLLLILTFGITAMMDIRTMDKFDDAKGKTITINTGE